MDRIRKTKVIRPGQPLKYLLAHTPQDVLAAMGLFDINLIGINDADLACLAPAALVGPLPKVDRNLHAKNSFSSSKAVAIIQSQMMMVL